MKLFASTPFRGLCSKFRKANVLNREFVICSIWQTQFCSYVDEFLYFKSNLQPKPKSGNEPFLHYHSEIEKKNQTAILFVFINWGQLRVEMCFLNFNKSFVVTQKNHRHFIVIAFEILLCQTNFLHHLLPFPLFSLTAKTGITCAIRFLVALFIHRGTQHCHKWKRLKLKRPSKGKVENLMLGFVLFRGAKPPTCGCFKRIHGCPTLKQPIRDPDLKLRFLVTTTKSSAFMHMSK